MEPEVSIEGSAMIQVAVVPIGTVPSNLLQDYYSMLLPLHTISLSAISSFYTEHQKSPFAVQPWDSSSLRFKFVLGGAPPSPWEDFQYHRKTLAIVGVVHCPSSPDLNTTVDLFANACKSFPSSLVDRCFAFCPDDSQLEDGSKKGGKLRLFPPADRPTLEFHLNTMMQEIAASLLMEFEKWVLQAESSGTILKTPLDSQASLSSEEVIKVKKRRLGRAQKAIGDCCMLAGSPVDANAHYSTALELARLTGDYFWYAGALEGSVCALLIDRMGQKDSAMEDEVRYRYNSVILNYKKSQDNAQRVSPLTFELEATLKLARFLCRRELSKEVVELLTTAADGAKSLIDASDRLILYNEIARLYASLGYHRKAAFFSRQVAQLYLQQENSVDVSVECEIASFRDSETRNNLRRILESCSKLVEAGDFHESENTVSELVKFLGSVYDAAVSDPDSEHAENEAFEAIFEIHRYICSPSLHQEVVDALSFELPKVVSKFVGISSRFLDMAINIIDQFIVKCGPRDMLSILCNTLGYSTKITKAASYIVPPLSGISKVFISIQRRQFEQVKEAVPIILNVLKAVPLESEEELESVFDRAVGIANSMYQVCNKLEGDAKEKLQTLLGLYVLQCMALISASLDYKASSCHSFVSQLSQISSYCGLSYLSLLTTYEVETMAGSIFGEDKDHYMGFLSHVKLGAALSVIWGLVSEEIAHTAKENLTAIKDELCNNQTKRWQAIGSLKQVLSFVNLPWELKKHAIDFLLCITDGRVSRNCNEEHSEWSSYMPSLFSALQAVKMVIMHAPEPELRKKSFVVLKGVLADIPISQRLDILQALITNTDSSSMIAIFIDLIRKEMHTAICSNRSIVKDAPQIENKAFPSTPFWNPRVIELVELVLRPPQGGPPSLPEQGDAVLSALNLYRFVLMTESAEKTNCTGLLSRKSLLKAYNEWLLPLRTLVTGIIAESKSDYDEFAVDTVCTLNPLELVLYRCIELVEEKLKQST